MNRAIIWCSFWLGAGLTGCGGAPDEPTTATVESATIGTKEDQPHPGAETYQNYCFSCHTPGLNSAPKLGDNDAWAPRIAKGPLLLLQTTIEGMPPAMPPRGMCFACSDEDLAAAIDYMIIESQ